MTKKCALLKSVLAASMLAMGTAIAAWSQDPSAPTPVCDATGAQGAPMLVQVDGGFIVSWRDQRRGSCGYNCIYTDVYAQKFDLEGAMLWAENGRVVAAGPEHALVYPTQLGTGLVDDGAGGALVAWNDQLGVITQGYISNLTRDAEVAWGEPGVAIQGGDTAVTMPAGAGFSDEWGFAADSEGGVFAPLPAGGRIGRFDAMGRLRATWFEDPDIQYRVALVPALEPDGTDAVIAVWIKGNGYFVDSIVARKLVDPETFWPASPDTFDDLWGQVLLYDQTATFSAWRLTAVSDGAGGVIAAWVDNRSGSYRIRAQRVGADGNLPWGPQGVDVSDDITNANYWAFNLALAADGKGGALVAWNQPYDVPQVIKAQRLAADGTPQWAADGVVVANSTATYSPYLSGLVLATDGNAIVLYHNDSLDTGSRLIAQKLTAAQGEPLWQAGQVAYAGCFSTYYERARMVSDGHLGAVVAFAACDGNLYATRLADVVDEPRDLTGDGKADILLRNTATGYLYMWAMDGNLKTYYGISALPLKQQVVGIGDLSGDGNADILLRNTATGYLYMWEMNGNLKTYYGIGSLPLDREVVGLGDLTGDGMADILLRNTVTGYLYMWAMDGNLKAYYGISALPLNREVVGLADLTGDRKADILLRNTDTGDLYLWEMNGNLKTYYGIGTLPLNREVIGLADLTGDAKADILLRNTDTGYLYLWAMDGNLKTWYGISALPLNRKVVELGDLSGDGKADIVLRNTDTGYLYLWAMDGNLKTYYGIGPLALDREVQPVTAAE